MLQFRMLISNRQKSAADFRGALLYQQSERQSIFISVFFVFIFRLYCGDEIDAPDYYQADAEYTEHSFSHDGKAIEKSFYIKHMKSSLRNESDDKTAGYNGSYLTGNIYAYCMHEQEVLRIFRKSHLVDYARRHRESRNACRTYHRVYLLL